MASACPAHQARGASRHDLWTGLLLALLDDMPEVENGMGAGADLTTEQPSF
jgi:hypothetical protein